MNTQGKNGWPGGTIEFNPSEYQLKNGLPKESIFRYVYWELEEAKDRLETETLKYMEASYNKILQDFIAISLTENKTMIWTILSCK